MNQNKGMAHILPIIFIFVAAIVLIRGFVFTTNNDRPKPNIISRIKNTVEQSPDNPAV